MVYIRRTCKIIGSNHNKMKLSILFLLLVAIVYVAANPAKGSTKASIKKKACIQSCNDKEYKPFCAGDGNEKNKSFGSECALANYNCESGKELKFVSAGECPDGGSIRLS